MAHAFTNRLIHEISPYLLQHAHNPVNWYPWGEEALQKAKEENKVILVSIGYSACHWCHVMERESFENETVARIMNDHFVNIKIDREERPDLDHIYMDAVQAIAGNGGWPLNVFLTPDAKPFYGGTYFPPHKAYNRSSWTEVLFAIKQAWAERQNEIEAQADNLVEHLQQSGQLLQPQPVGFQNIHPINPFTYKQCQTITQNCLKKADTVWGGFGKAPKFPQTFTIAYLLQYQHFFPEKSVLQQALLALDKMIQGGIYDHLGGGFARYSTDEEWLVPHFEKMLYDNALLINTLCDAWKITHDENYKYIVQQTINFLQKEMKTEEGGFYAAIDADSEGEEGKYYVWYKNEIDFILGDEASLFCDYFDVTEKGNWTEGGNTGRNILRLLKTKADFLNEKKLSPEAFDIQIKKCTQQLLAIRKKRIPPQKDDKVLLNWNALLITALCKASASFNEPKYKELAQQTYAFIKKSFSKNSQELYHTYKNGQAKYSAFLDDYAFLIQACIALQEITSEAFYLEEAKQLTAFVIENFSDEENLFFFYTHKTQTDVIIRKKEVYDGATPSGNSVMAANLYLLSIFLNEGQWRERAEKMLERMLPVITKYPTSFANWAGQVVNYTVGINEIVITGKNYQPIRNNLMQYYIPNAAIQCADNSFENMPLLQQKAYNNTPLIYICKNYTCQQPQTSVEKVIELLSNFNRRW